jgi:hypothetical protein
MHKGDALDKDKTSMEEELQFTHKLTIAIAATFIVFASSAHAGSQFAENEYQLFSPNLVDIGSEKSDKPRLREKSSNAFKKDDTSKTQSTTLPQVSPILDLHWHSFGTDFGKTVDSRNQLEGFGNASPLTTSTHSIERFQLGDSYLRIQTQKTLQTPPPFRRSDCSTDDECADYSGLPKSKSPKSALNNLKNPFIGLSFTTPLQ